MKRKSKPRPAPKAAVKAAAKRKSAPPKASAAKTVAKKAAPGKSVARKGAAARAGQGGSGPKPAKSKVKSRPAATEAGPDSSAQDAPLLDALDRALSGISPRPVAMSGERRGNDLSGNAGNDRGRPPAWRPSLGETGPDSAEAPARTNKLVPTNAVHTTKRRMKRNTWQSPVLGLGFVAAVLAVLVLGNDNQPPDVSPLERRAEAGPSAPSRQTAKTPPTQEQVSPRGLKVLELVEMERMLARLEMDPSPADGIVDRQTRTAIRTYQQIAGLPVDGEATPELLDDMREVVKMMDGTN